MTASKAELRERFSAARRGRSDADLAAARTAVRHHVLAHGAAADWTSVAAYEPWRTEPGSVELLADLHAARVRVLVPVTLADRDLDWVEWSPSGHGAPLGVTAVADVDAVLVPALAVARDGTRLGRGGGSYDRALARVGASTPVAAVLFDDELVADLPRDDWDRPVHAVVRPGGWTALR